MTCPYHFGTVGVPCNASVSLYCRGYRDKLFEHCPYQQYASCRDVPDEITLCAWCRSEIVDDPVTSEATGSVSFCSTSDLFEALTQMKGEVKEIVHDPDGDSLLQCPQCGESSYATSDKWSSEGPFIVPAPDGLVFSIMTCPVCGYSAPLVEKVLP